MIPEPHSGSTRAAILKEARRLVQTRSYLGFSFQDLADRIGIKKPSLYHHFPSKEALVVEVLRQNVRMFHAWAAGTPQDPAAKFLAYFSMYRVGLNPGHAMCPAGSMAPGWDCIDESVRQAARELRAVQIDWLRELLRKLRPELPDPEQAAVYVFATCQGAMQTARMTGVAEDFDAAIAPMQQSLVPPQGGLQTMRKS